MNSTLTAEAQTTASMGSLRRTKNRLRPTLARAGRDLLYLALGTLTAIAGFVAWVAGLSIAVSFALFIVGIPVVILVALVFRGVAELDRRNAAVVLGSPLRGGYRPRPGVLLQRLSATLRDPQTWRDLAWLVLHSVLGFAFGIAAISAVATVIGVALLPAWYWAVSDGATPFGGWWEIDTLWEALAAAPLAIPLAALTVGALRLMALMESGLATLLLGSAAPDDAGESGVAIPSGRELGLDLPVHVAGAAIVGLVATTVWALTGGAFWPAWVWLGLGITIGLHWISIEGGAASDPVRAFQVKAQLAGMILAASLIVWALGGGGYLWPAWVALGLAATLALIALFSFRHRLPGMRERELAQRVDVLTRTRRGALDVQAAELRRIERDLHDGAQARLVALSMQLGRAEERLSDQPEIAALLEDARGEANAAIAELRDLARGIAPPVLADRGLAAAVEALGRRVSTPVAVVAEVEPRPPAVIETAAYFVVAESLTNVAKHAPGARAHVSIAGDASRLRIEVADDGPGGAEPAGGGLTGLAHRVEALDGQLTVTSPPGEGTTIRAELPCEL